jgi:biotin carboxylase
MATRTYRARAFLRAARALQAEVVVGSERKQALARQRPGTTLALRFAEPAVAVQQIIDAAHVRPFDAIVGVDDDTTLVAALAAQALGLPGNHPDAVRATRDKALMRRMLAAAGAPSPDYLVLPLDRDNGAAALRQRYPCVIKPLALSASRGVIRADDPAGFVAAVARIQAILASSDELSAEERSAVLVEEFLPGVEVALEGMLIRGRLKTLTIFDKPDPLDGPYFEETIYVTPSRLPAATQAAIERATADGAAALGLREGPLHAELRVNDHGVWIVEIAARSIGGLCSSALEFSGGRSLEELILLHATGADVAMFERVEQPSGVMMLPIRRAGVLHEVEGQNEARAVPGIVDLEISVPRGERLEPLPEGGRYLGFLFARGTTPAAVEDALRAAHARLRVRYADELADSAPVSTEPLPISGSRTGSAAHYENVEEGPQIETR